MKKYISGIGIDIEETKRFKRKKENKGFLKIVFSERELNYCMKKKDYHLSLAGKFCAKEAVIKSLNKPCLMKDIEIINLKSGKIEVYINKRKKRNIYCSISHTKDFAIAFAILTD
mgnify:CR=1 FL=1